MGWGFEWCGKREEGVSGWGSSGVAKERSG